jgi:hypothetical protein
MTRGAYSDKEMRRILIDHYNQKQPITLEVFQRLLDTIAELKETNHRLFKDVLTLKKNLGEYHELCMSDVVQKKRIKELQAIIDTPTKERAQ